MRVQILYIAIRTVLVLAAGLLLVARWHDAGFIAFIALIVGLRLLQAHLSRRERERLADRKSPPP